MSLRFFVHIFFLRKWFIIIPLFLAPIAAGVMLLFVEPQYISVCKIEFHNRVDPMSPVSEKSANMKDDEFVLRQRNLILTDEVIGKVVDKAQLAPWPPSQSLWAKYAKSAPKATGYTPERERIEAVRTLKKSIAVETPNPSNLDLGCAMNTPELAQKVTQLTYESYVEVFERLQNETITKLENYYTETIKRVESELNATQKEMDDFYSQHPEIERKALQNTPTVPDKPAGPIRLPIDPPELKDNAPSKEFIGGNGSATETALVQIMTKISALEIELIDAEARFNPNAFRVRTLKEELDNYRALEATAIKKVQVQRGLELKFNSLQTKKTEILNNKVKFTNELDKIKADIAKRIGASSLIQLVDRASYDPVAVYPKKILTMLAATFIGLMLGLGLAYIVHVLDGTYHMPEDFVADTGLPVLAALPAE